MTSDRVFAIWLAAWAGAFAMAVSSLVWRECAPPPVPVEPIPSCAPVTCPPLPHCDLHRQLLNDVLKVSEECYAELDRCEGRR